MLCPVGSQPFAKTALGYAAAWQRELPKPETLSKCANTSIAKRETVESNSDRVCVAKQDMIMLKP